jgi:hypothetical protein
MYGWSEGIGPPILTLSLHTVSGQRHALVDLLTRKEPFAPTGQETESILSRYEHCKSKVHLRTGHEAPQLG